MDNGAPAPPWKGFDTRRAPRFLGYEQTERMLGALLDRAQRWRPDAVAGIARGGLVPATMAATALGLPLASIGYDRAADRAAWIGPPASGGRLLLVDDGVSSGRTMAGVRAALLGERRECLTIALVHDPDCASYVPDLSHPMRELWRFPWERGEATPAARALRAALPGRGAAEHAVAAEAPFVAYDLQAALGRRVPAYAGSADPLAALPFFAPERALVIGGRARAEAEALLRRWGHDSLPLECRPDDVPDQPGALARHKAAVATRWGCTHFVERDPQQAILIAAAAPHLVVIWCPAEGGGYVLGAQGNHI